VNSTLVMCVRYKVSGSGHAPRRISWLFEQAGYTADLQFYSSPRDALVLQRAQSRYAIGFLVDIYFLV